MQPFSALLGSQATGAPSPRTSSNADRTQDDATDPGGFDRLMQSQSRDDARSATPSPTQERERADGAGRRDAGKRAVDDEGPGSAKTQESRAEDGAQRAGTKDTGDSQRDAAADETATAEAGSATGDAPSTTAGAPVERAAPASPASLPEQLLALLNGLATAPAAIAATPDATAAALPTTATASGATGAAKPLPALQPPQALAAAATPAANDADAAAFAMAMNAAGAGAADAGADLANATTAPLGEAELTAQAAPLPGISTITSHPLSRATAAAVQAHPPLSLDTGFEDGFGSRIAWLAEQKVGHAEIRVSPDHLGTIDVRLQLDGNRVNAEFHSAQADVRQALESSLPRLREMLGQQGLQLGQADVGQRQAQQQASQGQASPSFGGGSDRSESANDVGWSREPAVRTSRGLLDEYA